MTVLASLTTVRDEISQSPDQCDQIVTFCVYIWWRVGSMWPHTGIVLRASLVLAFVTQFSFILWIIVNFNCTKTSFFCHCLVLEMFYWWNCFFRDPVIKWVIYGTGPQMFCNVIYLIQRPNLKINSFWYILEFFFRWQYITCTPPDEICACSTKYLDSPCRSHKITIRALCC